MTQRYLSHISILMLVILLSLIISSAYADDPGNTTTSATCVDSSNISFPCMCENASTLLTRTPDDNDVQKGPAAFVTDNENVTGGVETLLTREAYDNITNVSRNYYECWERSRVELGLPNLLNGQWYYTYENMTAAMNADPKFAKEGDINTRKLEIAAFLANVAQETGSKTAGDPYGGPGCQIQEGWGSAAMRFSKDFGEPPVEGGAGFCGRGPLQLTYLVNYRTFGNETGKGDLYYYNPDLLTIEPLTGIGASLWFWNHAEKGQGWPDTIPFKPSAHDVVVGKWQPTDLDIACGRCSANFGIIINIINGGVECGHTDARATQRVSYLIAIAREMGVTIPPGFAVDCAGQKNFAICQSYKPPSDSPSEQHGDGPEMLIASASPADQTVTFTFEENLTTYPLSIQSVSFVPNQPVSETQCIIDDEKPLAGFAYSGGPAAYKIIELNWVNPSAIKYGTIRFSVLGSWLRENKINPADIVMVRQNDYAWSKLPTTFDHQAGDVYYYYAITPGFSYFAVTGKKTVPVTNTVTEVSPAPVEESRQDAAIESNILMTTIPTTLASAYIAPEKTGTPVPAAPEPGIAEGTPVVYWAVLSGVIVLVAAVAILGRRWWLRRQNPKLFGKE
ncbi:MAG: Chitinase class I [Methanoregulaceae archaeon PtaB.Bin056]|nr:MAG: Chitinase class I [Methanoregulaceae archaeon PtaB.Bin056]